MSNLFLFFIDTPDHKSMMHGVVKASSIEEAKEKVALYDTDKEAMDLWSEESKKEYIDFVLDVYDVEVHPLEISDELEFMITGFMELPRY